MDFRLADLDDVADQVGQDLVLFDLLSIVAYLFLHDVLLVLQSRRLGPHDLFRRHGAVL